MNESQFRILLGEAIGNEPPPPWLATSVRTRLEAPRARSVPTHLMVAVATAAVVVLGGVVGLQLLVAGRAPIIGPAATPSASPSPNVAVVDPTNCLLPVMVERGAGPPSQLSTQIGFVNTRTGRYTRDASVSLAGLPRSVPYGWPGTPLPIWYSPAVNRWLPIVQVELAPDGLSYLWTRTLPLGVSYPKSTSEELHRYDVANAVDHVLWKHAGAFAVQRWDSKGILVDAGPADPNAQPTSWWIINPATGAAVKTAALKVPFPPFKPLPGDPKNFAYNAIGVDADGHTLWHIGDQDQPGSLNWVFYEISPGHRVTIYRGSYGDATGAILSEATADSTGIWFVSFDSRVVWHWQQNTGLRKLLLTGLPQRLTGANTYIQVRPKGVCF